MRPPEKEATKQHKSVRCPKERKEHGPQPSATCCAGYRRACSVDPIDPDRGGAEFLFPLRCHCTRHFHIVKLLRYHDPHCAESITESTAFALHEFSRAGALRASRN